MLAISCALFSTVSVAKESPFQRDDTQFLVESCREAMELFKGRDEPAGFAAFRTSLSESMRAGYCIGVLKQYARTSNNCYYEHRDWYGMAEYISAVSDSDITSQYSSPDKLLLKSYCDY